MGCFVGFTPCVPTVSDHALFWRQLRCRALVAAWILHHSDDSMELGDCEYALEVAQYIADATKLVNHTAAQGGCLHVSQSFSGSPKSSAIVTSLVACPESLVLKVQEAIDRAVEVALCEVPMFKPMVH